MRYRYVAYKYSRKVSPDTTLQNIWETFGTWAVPMTTVWRPPTDVYETPEQLIVVIEIAGAAEEQLSVTLFSDLLIVEGVREFPSYFQPSTSSCHQLSIKYGQFRSEIFVPFTVDHEKVAAEYQNGFLKITLNRRS